MSLSLSLSERRDGEDNGKAMNAASDVIMETILRVDNFPPHMQQRTFYRFVSFVDGSHV